MREQVQQLGRSLVQVSFVNLGKLECVRRPKERMRERVSE